MASLPIYYHHNQPLMIADDDDNNTNNLAPSPGPRGRPIARSRSALARRANSSSLNKDADNNGDGSVRLRRSGDPEDSSSGELSSSIDRIKRCQTAPGYVSFDDIIGGDEAFGRCDSWREADGVISHPLVRTASRLYALTDATDRQPPRHRRPSPGPLGTRRGSALHWLAKRYFSPCLGFLTSALCRSAKCSV